jgi:hypothetical protein
MCQRFTIQTLAQRSPLGQKDIHVGSEAVVVMPLQEMHHFVNQDIFQAFVRLSGEVGVEADTV